MHCTREEPYILLNSSTCRLNIARVHCSKPATLPDLHYCAKIKQKTKKSNHPPPLFHLRVSFSAVKAMFRLLATAALVGLATAQSVTDMKNTANSNNAGSLGADQRMKPLEGKGDAVSSGMDAAADSLITVDAIVNTVNAIAGESSSLEQKLNQKVDQASGNMGRDLADSASSMNDALEVALDEITRALSSQKETIEGSVVGRLSTANANNAALIDTADDLSKRLKAHTDCANDGKVYDATTEECRGTSVAPEKSLTKVAHRMFNNDDGREGGYVDNRYVTFKKTQDDTYIRVFYHENFRVHGHGAWARWHIMICDANGNGCDFCNNPGRMQYWRYAYHQHNWWMNDHWSGSIAGLCKTSGNRNMKKGDFRLRVYIDSARYDTYTGANTHSSFMVDEVFKF